MQAVIMATEQNESFLPMVENGCVALLPIAGRPAIEYAIESLHRIGIREAVIVTHNDTQSVQSNVGNGCRWGMQISYHQVDSAFDGYVDISSHKSDETLVVQGDAFWNLDLDHFLDQARNSGKQQVIATYHNQPIAKWVKGDLWSSAMNHIDAELHSSLCVNQNAGAYFFPLHDYMCYFRVNMALVNGQLVQHQPSGRMTGEHLFMDVGAKINDSSTKTLSAAFVGRNSHVHRTAALSGIVAIDSNVVIDRLASVENSLVLPGTYIGEMMCVRDSIVSGNTYVNVYSGSAVTIDDTLMMAAI